MILLALISGLINLSSQVVYQKVVSMVAGDLYTTFMAVTLTFIFGSAIGSYFGNRVRRYLPYIELGAGIFSLLVFFLLQGPFYEHRISTALVIAGLFLPALALGTHIPLYSYYLRRMRFGFVYCLYHFGAIFGLLAFEWYYVNAGSVKASMFVVAITQIALGLVLVILSKFNRFLVEDKQNASVRLLDFFKNNQAAVVNVVLASTFSFYIVLWALKTQTMMTETYRLHATSVSVAVFFWMALAGVLNKGTKYFSMASLFLGMAISFVFIQGGFPVLGPDITRLYTGVLSNYFAVSFILSIFFTVPVFFSSLIFVKQTQELQTKYDVDVASGILNLFSGAGNILGFVVAGTMARYFWTKEYFLFAIVLVLVFSLILSAKQKNLKRISPVVLVLVVCAIFFSQKNHKDYLFETRLGTATQECEKFVDIEVYSHPFTTMALMSNKRKENIPNHCFEYRPRRYYVVDGHISHNIWSVTEFLVGLSSAQYFDRPLKNSLVIGIGSGQAAWGVAAISEHTDLVEISPVVIDNLDHLKDLNGDLKNRANIKFILDDGFSVVRDCKPGSLDLIFNTSTYPSSFNASKLYSDEFVGLAKKCLGPEGVYQTYFDENSVRDMETFFEFMAPIQKHFKYVDVMLQPYPQVYATNSPTQIHTLTKKDFLKAEDLAYFSQKYAGELDIPCRPFFRMIARPEESPRMTTLDRAYLEQNTILSAIDLDYSESVLVFPFVDIYAPKAGAKPVPTCE